MHDVATPNRCVDCRHSVNRYAPISAYDSGWDDWFCYNPKVVTVDYVSGAVSPKMCDQVRSGEKCEHYVVKRSLFRIIVNLFSRKAVAD